MEVEGLSRPSHKSRRFREKWHRRSEENPSQAERREQMGSIPPNFTCILDTSGAAIVK